MLAFLISLGLILQSCNLGHWEYFAYCHSLNKKHNIIFHYQHSQCLRACDFATSIFRICCLLAAFSLLVVRSFVCSNFRLSSKNLLKHLTIATKFLCSTKTMLTSKDNWENISSRHFVKLFMEKV